VIELNLSFLTFEMQARVIIDEKVIIEKYLGIPFKHRGRDLRGLDCYGLIINVYRDLGYELFDIEEDYDESWAWKERSLFLENYHKQWKRIERPSLYDVVLFSNLNGIAIHAGLVLNNNRFIHCKRKTGVIISRLGELFWWQKIEGFYRFRARDDNG